ncbi:MAG TPA: KipI antagonist, partial [Syntrophales bacterium]|nr:KipI antagonist [Syntrophales bacterium]
IVLLVEQTTGGYTKIATVISTDIPRLAQAIPGNRVRFQRVTLEEAHRLYAEQARMLSRIKTMLTT